MKTSILILISALALSGCCTCPTHVPTAPTASLSDAGAIVAFQGARYVAVKLPLQFVPVGSVVIYRQPSGEVVAAKLLSLRAPGVYRIAGEGLQLVHAGNYVAQLVPFGP